MNIGIELIAKERQEQIEKHGYSLGKDQAYNGAGQLWEAAVILASETWGASDVNEMTNKHRPVGWDKAIWNKMLNKPHKERLIIAGALIAAELDRLETDDNL